MSQGVMQYIAMYEKMQKHLEKAERIARSNAEYNKAKKIYDIINPKIKRMEEQEMSKT